MPVLLDLHQKFAWFAIIANGLVGLWVTAAHWIVALRTKIMWWFVGVAWVSVAIQVLMGVGLVTTQHLSAPRYHMFYGFVSVIAIAIIYSYRAQMRHKIYLLVGLGSLFLMGLAIRAVIVGRVG